MVPSISTFDTVPIVAPPDFNAGSEIAPPLQLNSVAYTFPLWRVYATVCVVPADSPDTSKGRDAYTASPLTFNQAPMSWAICVHWA